MKQFLLLVFILLSINILNAQDTTFNKYLYPYTGMTNINSLLVSGGFNYSLILNRQYPLLIQKIGILKIDNAGDIIKSNTFSFGNKHGYVNLGHGFSSVGNNNFICCGTIWSSSEASKGVIIKIDSNLDTLWTKEFSHPDTVSLSQSNPTDVFMECTEIKETPDGGFIIIGNYNKNCTGYANRSFLIKLDSAGNLLWHKLNPTNVSIINDIEIDPIDSGFYYAYSYNWSPWLRKVDKFGNLVWLEQFNTILSSPYLPVNPFDIEIVDSNTLVVASTGFKQSTGHSEYAVVTSFNTNNHNRNWEKKYRVYLYFQNMTLDQSININITKDHNIVVSGTAHVVSPDSTYGARRGAILKINRKNGDSLWSRYYAHNWNDSDDVDLQLNDLVVCDDGGFLFGGFASVSGAGFTNSWLVKTDSLGMTQAAFTVGVEDNTLVIKKSEPLLYPNPAVNDISLRFEDSQNRNIELSIFSSTGALVKQQLLTGYSNEYRINIQDLSTGVYVVKLVSDNRIIYSSKFIKQK